MAKYKITLLSKNQITKEHVELFGQCLFDVLKVFMRECQHFGYFSGEWEIVSIERIG